MSTHIGNRGEVAAAEYLVRAGYKLLHRNWKTPLAEIDIVCQKNGCVYFVEVKYRSTAHQGDGLDYVHAKKLKKMMRGAELWVMQNNWAGEYQLAAIAVTAEYDVAEFILIDY